MLTCTYTTLHRYASYFYHFPFLLLSSYLPSCCHILIIKYHSSIPPTPPVSSSLSLRLSPSPLLPSLLSPNLIININCRATINVDRSTCTCRRENHYSPSSFHLLAFLLDEQKEINLEVSSSLVAFPLFSPPLPSPLLSLFLSFILYRNIREKVKIVERSLPAHSKPVDERLIKCVLFGNIACGKVRR